MKCYLCGSKTGIFIRKLGFTIYRCPVCGLSRTDLKKNYHEFLSAFYTEGYFTGDPRYSAYTDYRHDKTYITKNMRKVLTEIQKHSTHSSLLDVGCAYGYFIDLARAAGFDAHGFDTSAFAVREARKLVGNRAIHGTVQNVAYRKKSFDIITLLDVFEHLDDPAKDLSKLRSFLKDDGILVIATGDTGSLLARILKRRWTFYVPPQHLFFFDKYTLSRILSSVGLTPITWFRVGKWLSLSYILHLARTTGESTFARRLYPVIQDSWVGKLPLYLPVQDNIVVIAGKTSRHPRLT
jgi:SAM-dependent methyltransferase